MADNDNALKATRDRHGALASELADLPAAITAAQKAVKVEDWMRLNARQAELPALVDASRAELLPLEIADMWRTAESLHRDEVRARRTAKAADKALAVQVKEGSLTATTALERAQATLRSAEAGAAVEAANGELQVSVEAVGHALFAIDALEGELEVLTGEPPQDGSGLRARRPISSNVLVRSADVGELAGELHDGLPGATAMDYDGEPRVLFEKGAVPPRWISHRFGDHVFVEQPEFGAPTEAEIAIGRQREEALERLPIGEPTRLGPGGVPSWMPAGRAR